ncbi:MAG: autotransporter-associated beta strand repeat-containing protein [Akkermansia sp.]|nr:autotransporter-associated beta strand repeat-containing protein [Akkermansia sp.]
MKLHLPKMLLTAVLAACVAPAYAESEVVQWQTPVFGGTEYKWTGGAGTQDYATDDNWSNNAAPERNNNKGPVLVYDGVTVSVNGGEGVDTSDKGGIKVINGSVVASTLGRWGGSIFVEYGSELTTSLNTSIGTQLKNTESADTANVYVGGKLTITNTALNLNDGNTWQNWQIDTYGSVDITAATSINLEYGETSYSWNLQYLKADDVTAGLDESVTVKNRQKKDITFTQKLISSSVSLSDKIDSVTVFDKATGEVVAAENYTLTYGEGGGLSISYTAQGYEAASLQTSGNITWKHGGDGWMIVGDAAQTDTSFLNGDTVTFAGDGTASLLGDVIVSDITVGEGVNYTVNMADNSSLCITTQKDNFIAGFKITGGESTSLHLNMSTKTDHTGDSTIVLSEGSSVGAVYVDGVFAYNVNNTESVSSNLRGADLHLSNGGVLLLRNKPSGIVNANIGDIYFVGNGEIRTCGGITAGMNTEIQDNIYAWGILKTTDIGSLKLSGDIQAQTIVVNSKDAWETKGTISLSGSVKADNIIAQGGNLNLSGTVNTSQLKSSGGAINISGTSTVTGSVTASQLRLGEGGEGNVTISKYGKLTITGTTNGHGTAASILLGYDANPSTLLVDGGELVANDTVVRLSWNGAGTLEVKNGTANVKGLNFWGENAGGGLAGHFKLGSDDGDGTARINIGSEGIAQCSYKNNTPSNLTITLSNGIIGATADWTTSYNRSFTPVTFNLTGAGTGTVFDTADANGTKDASGAVLGRTITIDNSLGGTGKLEKKGAGTLVLQCNNTYSGGTTITGGVLKTTHKKALGSGTLTFNGGTLTLASDLDVNSIVNKNDATKNLQGYTLSVTNGVTGDNNLVVQNGTLIIGKDLTLNGNLTLEKYTTGEDENAVTHGAEIQLYGKDNTVNVLDLSNNNKAKGKVVLKESSATSIKNGYGTDSGALWMNSSSYIELEKDASLTWEKAKVIGISSETKGQISTTSENEDLYLGSTSATISNVKLTVTEESNTDVNINLQNVELTNDGTGTLTLTNSDNTLTALHALKGNVSVTGQDELVLNALTIAQGNTLTVDTVAVGGSSVVYSAENTGATATLEGGATINGSLNLSNASSLTLDGIGEGSLVKITGDLILPVASETPTLTLSGDILSSLNAMNQGDELGIFSVRGGFFVGNWEINALDATNGIPLNTVFSAGEGYNFEDYYLGFTPGIGDEAGYSTVYIGKIVPEPTTATLSLLALAALAARRRRR